jgi:hypothetical protein
MLHSQLVLIRSDSYVGRDALANRPFSVPSVSAVLIQLALLDSVEAWCNRQLGRL